MLHLDTSAKLILVSLHVLYTAHIHYIHLNVQTMVQLIPSTFTLGHVLGTYVGECAHFQLKNIMIKIFISALILSFLNGCLML